MTPVPAPRPELADADGGRGATPVPDAPVRRPRGRPRNPDADRRILEAASALIVENGLEDTTVDKVAARARVGKATAYRRWARKEDLAVAAMTSLYDVEIPIVDTGDLRHDLIQVYRLVLEFAHSDNGQALLRTCVAESGREPRIREFYRAANSSAEASARATYQPAVGRGELRADARIEFAVSMLAGLLTLHTVTGEPPPPVSEAESLVDLLLHGIGT